MSTSPCAWTFCLPHATDASTCHASQPYAVSAEWRPPEPFDSSDFQNSGTGSHEFAAAMISLSTVYAHNPLIAAIRTQRGLPVEQLSNHPFSSWHLTMAEFVSDRTVTTVGVFRRSFVRLRSHQVSVDIAYHPASSSHPRHSHRSVGPYGLLIGLAALLTRSMSHVSADVVTRRSAVGGRPPRETGFLA